MLVTASQEAGVLEEHEEQMLHRVFGFADLTAGQQALANAFVQRPEFIAKYAASLTLDQFVDAIFGDD